MTELRIEARRLSKRYGSLVAVDELSFEVCAGEVLGFLGPNGAGKSTTIKLITGILYPDTGTIRVLGLDPHRQRRQLAYRIGINPLHARIFGGEA